MNIFMIHKDPFVAAEQLADRHVVKMILESCQLLSTAHRILDGEEYYDRTANGRRIKRWRLNDDRENILYKATHVNHPCSVWCRGSVGNYSWLYDHLIGLCQEYTHRYNKVHKAYGGLTAVLASPPFNLTNFEMTEMPPAMPENFVVDKDIVESYRNYYREGKSHLHTWKNRNPPNWLLG